MACVCLGYSRLQRTAAVPKLLLRQSLRLSRLSSSTRTPKTTIVKMSSLAKRRSRQLRARRLPQRVDHHFIPDILVQRMRSLPASRRTRLRAVTTTKRTMTPPSLPSQSSVQLVGAPLLPPRRRTSRVALPTTRKTKWMTASSTMALAAAIMIDCFSFCYHTTDL